MKSPCVYILSIIIIIITASTTFKSYPFPVDGNSRRDSTHSKPHYGFPESHSNQTSQPIDALRRGDSLILTLIPMQALNMPVLIKHPGHDWMPSGTPPGDSLCLPASWLTWSFEQMPGNIIPLDIIPVFVNAAVNMSKRTSGSAVATVMGWTDA